MALLVSKLTDWLARHREKLIDAALLAFALNYAGLFTAAPPPSFGAQLAILGLFAVLAPSRAHEIPGLWRRYLKLLPAYLATAVAGAGLLLWWLNLPRPQAWFAPFWLGLTLLARLPWVALGRQVIGSLQGRRFDILALDLFLWLAAAWAVPRWTGLPGVSLPVCLLIGGAWIGLHALGKWHDPVRPALLSVGGAPLLALAWASAWRLGAGPGASLPGVVFGLWLGFLLVLGRLASRRWGTDGTAGILEVVRWLGLLLAGFALFHPFARSGLHGSGDALYYATFLADALEQFRHGIFPVFVGQTEFQFNGSVIPIRIAPGFQYFGGFVDLLTVRSLGPMAVQNLVIVLTGLAGLFSAYACLRRTGLAGALAWPLALLYLSCPGAAGLAFNSDLYMSWLTFPWVPPVLLFCVLSFHHSDWRLYAALGSCLGLTWWLHTPVALWLTFIACALQVARLLVHRPARPVLVREFAAGALSFLLAAAYPVVSAVLYPADAAMGSSVSMSKQAGVPFVHPAGYILEQLQATFPAAWQPMSPYARILSDYQLGYGLLLLGTLSGIAAWRTHRLELRLMTGLAAGLLLLLVPVPWLNLHLWRLVPVTVISVTNIWIMQRLYLLLAGLVVFLAAVVWRDAASSRFTRIALLAACLWSLLEATKFVRGSYATTGPENYTTHSLLPENVVLTRYSYGLFAAKPAYFTHGATDPVLENRFLDADLRTPLGGNPSAARAAANTPVSQHRFFKEGGRLVSAEPLVLQPGRRYLVEVTTAVAPFPSTTVALAGPTLRRLYSLPEYGESRAFGLGATAAPFFAIHTSSSQPEPVAVQLIPADSANLALLDGRITLSLFAYDPASLPVRIRSWMPYAATVQSPAALWLETPRMHQPGYVATVNGRPAEVGRSSEGLVSVAVPAGPSEVVLRYAAPAGLAAAFWLSFSVIVSGLGWILLAGWRELRASPAAPASPAGSAP